MSNIDTQKYRVSYTLTRNIHECKYFATFEEAMIEYIKRITPTENGGWNKARLMDTHIAEWNEKEEKYINLK